MVCPCKLLVSAKSLGQGQVIKKREVDKIYLNTKCNGLRGPRRELVSSLVEVPVGGGKYSINSMLSKLLQS